MASDVDYKKVKSVAIVLAAGSSSRMGQSKQLLKVGNESLLKRTIRTVLDTDVDATIVVLGSNQQVHQKEICDFPIHVINNEHWQNGMGSSLKSGTYYANVQFPLCESILVTVSDQPLLTSDHLNRLLEASQSTKNQIIASFYSGSPGVPALFNRSMFQMLLELSDQHGAKQIIAENINAANLIDFPEGAIDLDTPDDWKKFLQS